MKNKGGQGDLTWNDKNSFQGNEMLVENSGSEKGEIMQMKHTKVCWWGIDEIESLKCSNAQI